MIRKILIVSDSHGKSKNISRAIDKERPDMLIHLGDIEDDPEKIRRWLDEAAKKRNENISLPIPAVFVQGNCDRYMSSDVSSSLKQVAMFELNDHKFFCCHGHVQGVNYGLENLMYTAIENGCDIAMYGHTHVPFNDMFDGFGDAGESVHILNPGSISLPRGGNPKSYMVLNFDDNNDYEVELKSL